MFSSIPTISRDQFVARLSKRKYEDLDLVAMIERYVSKKRGFVFRMPRPGSRVVLMASGGIDSTVAWYILMKEFGLHVYPFMVTNDNHHAQVSSLSFFSKMYRKKFVDLYHAPLVVPEVTAAREIFDMKKSSELTPRAILDSYDPQHKTFNWRPGAGSVMLEAGQAALYMGSLRSRLPHAFTTIFCGVTAMDGMGVKSQTLTFLRTSLLYMMTFLADPTLQYASLYIEKETGWFARKADIIRIGVEAMLPLERTFSCYRSGSVHCGRCGGCDTRRWEFKQAGVVDKTIYETEGWIRSRGKVFSQRLTGLLSGR
ncbi:MAG: 7-cyano-7-deazaguanine synthase [Candidatus Gottesmanbacteria bacterium]|nr:7-cyano-7-deazaguanine synthase [Candidatus Gottesmanbacteria bacterium]